MKESTVEKKVTAYAQVKGWMAIKLSGYGNRGKPDRMYLRRGEAVFVEFKAPGRKASEQQKHYMHKLKAQGFKVHIIDNVRQGYEVINRDFEEEQHHA